MVSCQEAKRKQVTSAHTTDDLGGEVSLLELVTGIARVTFRIPVSTESKAGLPHFERDSEMSESEDVRRGVLTTLSRIRQ